MKSLGWDTELAREVSDVARYSARHCNTDQSLRKEVIQPQVLLRLPCYDLTPVTSPTVVGCLLLRG